MSATGSAGPSANQRVPAAPACVLRFTDKVAAVLNKQWNMGIGAVNLPDFRVFVPNPTFKAPARLSGLDVDAFMARGSVVVFWVPQWFWREAARIVCPRCTRSDAIEPQGWGKIRRVMGLVPHYLVPYRYRCKHCYGEKAEGPRAGIAAGVRSAPPRTARAAAARRRAHALTPLPAAPRRPPRSCWIR